MKGSTKLWMSALISSLTFLGFMAYLYGDKWAILFFIVLGTYLFFDGLAIALWVCEGDPILYGPFYWTYLLVSLITKWADKNMTDDL